MAAEELISLMDAIGRGLKRARTVRSEYLSDVDDVHRWLQQAEVMVQDRGSEPQTVKEHIQVRRDFSYSFKSLGGKKHTPKKYFSRLILK